MRKFKLIVSDETTPRDIFTSQAEAVHAGILYSRLRGYSELRLSFDDEAVKIMSPGGGHLCLISPEEAIDHRSQRSEKSTAFKFLGRADHTGWYKSGIIELDIPAVQAMIDVKRSAIHNYYIVGMSRDGQPTVHAHVPGVYQAAVGRHGRPRDGRYRIDVDAEGRAMAMSCLPEPTPDTVAWFLIVFRDGVVTSAGKRYV